MKAIRITQERMDALLPDNVKNSSVVSENAKRLLATILNYYYCKDKVKENDTLFIGNAAMRDSVGIKMDNLIDARQELRELGLITTKAGKKRSEGEKAVATEYRVNWDNLMKPIQKPCFETLFAKFLKRPSTVEGTAYTNTYTNTDSNTNSESNTDSNTKININTIQNNTMQDKPIEDECNTNPWTEGYRREVFDRELLLDKDYDEDEYLNFEEKLKSFQELTKYRFNQCQAINFWKQNLKYSWTFVRWVESNDVEKYKTLIIPIETLLEHKLRK